MRIAVSSTDKTINSEVAGVFGRCPYFLIVKINNGRVEQSQAIENQSQNQSSGAGISTAQLLAENKIEAVITGNIGPKAMDLLGQFDIKVYYGQGKIKSVVEQFIKGKLTAIKQSSCAGCTYHKI